MEAVIVQIVSMIGTIVSAALVIDAYRDRGLVIEQAHSDPDLLDATTTRIVNMWVLLLLQAIFLTCAVIFGYVERPSALRDLALWLLISIPIILMLWAIWINHRRRKELRDAVKRNGWQGDGGESGGRHSDSRN